MRNFLRDEYLPVARESIGLSDMKGGEKLYQLLIEDTTTLPLTADYLYNLGMQEVKRIKADTQQFMEEVNLRGRSTNFLIMSAQILIQAKEPGVTDAGLLSHWS